MDVSFVPDEVVLQPFMQNQADNETKSEENTPDSNLNFDSFLVENVLILSMLFNFLNPFKTQLHFSQVL